MMAMCTTPPACAVEPARTGIHAQFTPRLALAGIGSGYAADTAAGSFIAGTHPPGIYVASRQNPIQNAAPDPRRGSLPQAVSIASTSRAPVLPPFNSTFYWQLQGTVPESPPGDVIDIDGFDNSAATFARLRSQGKYTIAYFSAGTWESWRPDAADFPEAVKARAMAGWPGEHWLNVARLDVLRPIMEARADVAADRGADAIEWDNVNVVENAVKAGVTVSALQQQAYNKMLADISHARGLAAIYKNAALAPWAAQYFDGIILESGYQYGEVTAASGFYLNNKPVWDVEYRATDFAKHCADARAKHIFVVQLKRALDGANPVNTCPMAPSGGRD